MPTTGTRGERSAFDEPSRRVGLRRRGRSREALIAMFLAATFGMMALLSIRVLPQLGRILLPQAGEPRPTAPRGATVPPQVPPAVVPGTVALSGEFALLTRPALPVPPPIVRAHRPDEPKPHKKHVAVVQGGVSDGQHFSTTKIKGIVPPPHPIEQPNGTRKEANGLKGKNIPGGDKDEEQQSGTNGGTGKGTEGQLGGKGNGGGSG